MSKCQLKGPTAAVRITQCASVNETPLIKMREVPGTSFKLKASVDHVSD